MAKRPYTMDEAADLIHYNCDPSALISFLLSNQPITEDDRQAMARLFGHDGGWQGIKVEIRRTAKGMPGKKRLRGRLLNYVRAIKRTNGGRMPPGEWGKIAARMNRSQKAVQTAYQLAEKEEAEFFAPFNEPVSKRGRKKGE